MRFDEPVRWPEGVRCPVMLTFDLDAELVWLDMDPSVADRPKTRSIGEYGPRRGVERILEVLGRHGIRGSFMIPGRNAETYPETVRAIAAAGHEIGNHGYRHENFGLLNRQAQREVLLRANDALERVTGQRPVGYRTPAGDMTPETPALLAELGFRWSSSTRGDDRPFFLTGDLVEIPAHWELDDFPYFMFNFAPAFPAGQGRIASYSQVYSIWQQEFDGYYKFGLCYVIMFHPQTIGTPGRIALLERLIAHMKSRPGVWFATGSEVADWWRGLGRPNDPGHPLEVYERARARR
jgi:peptidoglycan/xylan/chitin deacetylase (PgdA/CDA1 family)